MTAALGNTASITLLTAIPGSGKTLRLVGFIKRAIEAGETVFVCNVAGLNLPHIPFADPREWMDLPPGSVLVVDEAQNWFRARRSGDPPQYLKDMELIRHRGVRLVLATQQPTYLDSHLRGLVGLHEHLVRENGKEAAKIYRHNEVIDDVKSEKGRSRYDSEVWQFPKEDFAHYTSAEVHTVKRVMSNRMKKGLVFASAAAVVGLLVAWRFTGFFGGGSSDESSVHSAGTASGRPADGAGPSMSATQKHEPAALKEYIANLTPRIPTLPWSAPIHDAKKVQSEPRTFCMETGAGLDANGKTLPASFRCMSEQGSRIFMSDDEARMIARNGEPYNPYKKPAMEERPTMAANRGAGVSPAAMGGTPAPSSAKIIEAPQISGYGDMGPRDITAAP